jgi:hypothetical protein
VNETDWYRNAFFILHVDHHTREHMPVGQDADPAETERLVRECDPDVLQIHAKGRPGWTTYPTEVGHSPPQLECDVMQVWKTMAERLGKPFSAYYNIGRDTEIMRRRPEFNRVDAGGTPYPSMLCYESGVVEEYLWPQIREVIAKYDPDGFWFDGSAFTVNVCYCDACVARWKTLSDLPVPRSPDSPGWDRFKEMHRDIYRRLVRETAKMVHGLAPDCLVAFNLAYTSIMPERPDPQMAYLTRDVCNGVDALSMQAAFADGQGMPFDFMTAVWHGEEWGEIRPKPDEQLRQEIAVVISKGGRYSAWDDPTGGSGLRKDHLALLARLAPWLRERQEWCVHTRNSPDVSVLYSADSFYAEHRARTDVFAFRGSWNVMNALSDALESRHVLYEFVPDWRLAEDKVEGKALVLENLYALTPERAAAIRRYVEGGGTLLATGQTPLTGGPAMRELLGIETIGINSLIGGFVAPEVLAGTLAAELYRVKEADARVLWEATPAAAGSVRTSGWSAEEAAVEAMPLLTMRPVGQGTAFYCSAPLFTPPAPTDQSRQALIDHVLERVHPTTCRTIRTDAPPEVHVASRVRGTDRILHLVNMAKGSRIGRGRTRRITDIPSAPPCAVEIALPEGPRRVSLEPGGREPADWSYADGLLKVKVPAFALHTMVGVRN